MLPVPLYVQLLMGQAEVRREVYYQAGPRPQQLLYRSSALAVTVGHESHVEVGGLDLLRRNIGPIDGKLRVYVPDP